jgi:hypothetical protein
VQKKDQGALLGNPTNLGQAQAKGAAAHRTAADAFAANVLPIVRQIEAAGATTHRAIAAALNARGIRTVRGGAWHDRQHSAELADAGGSRLIMACEPVGEGGTDVEPCQHAHDTTLGWPARGTQPRRRRENQGVMDRSYNVKHSTISRLAA